MKMQPQLLSIEEQPAKEQRTVIKSTETVRIRQVNRDQVWAAYIDIERLIKEDHLARAIWELIGQLDLSAFLESKSAMGDLPGRPNTSPQLLISVWLYAYSWGTNSAREIAELCDYHPAFQWLTGMKRINHKSLSDFRTQHGTALEKLFVQVLAVMDEEKLIDLDLVTQDGTKIRAWASSDTYRREKTLKQRLVQAEKLVEESRNEDFEKDESLRKKKAQIRAREERVARMKAAIDELEKVREGLSKAEQEEARVSYTDPDARIIKGSSSGYQSAFNIQLTTDAKHKVIVAVDVTNCASDSGELNPGLKQTQDNLGRSPKKVVVDAGYTTYANVLGMERGPIELYASIPNTAARNQKLRETREIVTYGSDRFEFQPENQCAICPAGKILKYEGRASKDMEKYQADESDCGACSQKTACCGNKKSKLVQINIGYHAMARMKTKMDTEEGQAIYRKRGAIAEFPNAWFKAKFNFRQTYLRGLKKVRMDARWHAIAYNVAQWARLCWTPRFATQV